ncbi:MAG TPA: hypothetical protein VGU22_19680 [Methylomirabilota bacterium]|jgi:hypothetical protein|nr:hypothetical protein [Methylomirabilota bacterium]
MPARADLEKQLEAIVGHPVNADVARRLNFWAPIASYLVTSDRSHVTWMNLILAEPKYCADATILDASGTAATGSDGQRVFRLSEYVCLEATLLPPVNVVATSESPNPFFLTVEHALVDMSTDVEIKVSTWAPGGAAAPNVAFDWRCRVLYFTPIFREVAPRAADARGRKIKTR